MSLSEILNSLSDIIPVGSEAYLKIKRADEENKLIIQEKELEISNKKRTITLLYIIVGLLALVLIYSFLKRDS